MRPVVLVPVTVMRRAVTPMARAFTLAVKGISVSIHREGNLDQ